MRIESFKINNVRFLLKYISIQFLLFFCTYLHLTVRVVKIASLGFTISAFSRDGRYSHTLDS